MKIHIIGCSGSGKTYFAKMLSNKYNIPHYELDDIFWDHNSNKYDTKMPIEKRNDLLNDILSKDSWIIEGVYVFFVAESFKNADIIYVLNIPKYICKIRIVIRFLKRKLKIEKGKTEKFKSIYRLFKNVDIFANEKLIYIKQILKNYEDKVVWISDPQEIDKIINS